jgi:hypothetical protein
MGAIVIRTRYDEGTESADITMNENILLLDEYSKVKLLFADCKNYITSNLYWFLPVEPHCAERLKPGNGSIFYM